MKLRVSSILVALALVGLVAGCSKAPVAEFDSCKAALDNARLAEVDKYAPAAFKIAADSLNATTVEIQKQDGKFALFRSYGHSRELIELTNGLIGKAQTEAEAEKERVRLLDSTMIVEIDSLIVETNALLAKAPKAKGSAVDLKVMKADLDAAGMALAAAKDVFTSGKYLAAQSQLQAVQNQVNSVKQQVEAAIARLTGKK